MSEKESEIAVPESVKLSWMEILQSVMNKRISEVPRQLKIQLLLNIEGKTHELLLEPIAACATEALHQIFKTDQVCYSTDLCKITQ